MSKITTINCGGKNNNMILNCLSTIWKAGGEIVRDENLDYELIKFEKVPESCLKVAQSLGDEIEKYMKSVEGMPQTDQLVWRMMNYFLGWQINNDKIKDFFLKDTIGFEVFMDYQVQLAKNGWKDIYTDYRAFEDTNSNELKNILIKRVVEFGNAS